MKGYKIPLGFVEGYRNAIERYPKDSKYAWGMNAVVEALEVHPLEELDEDPWHTGTPTEDGYYLCHIQFYSEDYESDEEGYDITYEFKNGSWEEDDENVRIIAWQKIDHYKEKEK